MATGSPAARSSGWWRSPAAMCDIGKSKNAMAPRSNPANGTYSPNGTKRRLRYTPPPVESAALW